MIGVQRFIFRLLVLGIIVGLFTVSLGVIATGNKDYLVFLQNNKGQKTLNVIQMDGSKLHTIVSGKEIATYFINHHTLVYSDNQLYEYNPETEQNKLLKEFDHDERILYAFAMKEGGPDQAFIITGNEYSSYNRWYVLEFSDASFRKIEQPLGSSEPSSQPDFNSPDSKAVANIKQTSFSNHIELAIKEKVDGKFQTLWSSPKNMLILPARPIWAPNSRLVAFYGKEDGDNNNLLGSYSLYMYNLDHKELVLVQGQVLVISKYDMKVDMGEFEPNWSNDSNYLIIEYQPFGMPTESSVLKYRVDSGKKSFLNNSRGEKQYPSWSPSGKQNLLLFHMGRKWNSALCNGCLWT